MTKSRPERRSLAASRSVRERQEAATKIAAAAKGKHVRTVQPDAAAATTAAQLSQTEERRQTIKAQQKWVGSAEDAVLSSEAPASSACISLAPSAFPASAAAPLA